MLTRPPINQLEYEDGIVIVVFKNGVSSDAVTDTIKALGLNLITYFDQMGTALVSVPVGKEDYFIAEFLKLNEVVDSAERSRLVHIL